MLKIRYYQVYSIKNTKGLEEPVCVCLDLDRAKDVANRSNKGSYRYITARPPFEVVLMEREYEPVPNNIQF
jgi:hypothetical protein